MQCERSEAYCSVGDKGELGYSIAFRAFFDSIARPLGRKQLGPHIAKRLWSGVRTGEYVLKTAGLKSSLTTA